MIVDLTAPVADLEDGFADGASLGKQTGNQLLYTLHVDDLTDVTMQSSWGDSHVFTGGSGLLQGAAPLVEGTNTFAVTLTDAVGHQTVVTRTAIYDITPPVATATGLLAAAGSPVRGTVELSADAIDNLTGIAAASFEIDGTSYPAAATANSFAATLDTTTLGDGPHTVHATFRDGVGNSTTIASSLLVDNTLPAVSIDAPVAGAYVHQTIALTASAGDATSGISGIQLFVNGGPAGSCTASPCTKSFDTTTLANGPFVVTAVAVDRAGNRASVDVTAKSDNTAPSKFLVSPVNGATLAGTATVSVNVVDDAFAGVECFVDGASLGASTSPTFSASINLLTKLDGPMVVRCTARDLAGNAGTETATVTIKNWTIAVQPNTLNLKSQGNDITLAVEGKNVALLLPVTDKALSIVVPGGSPVAVTAVRNGYQLESDGGIPEVELKFDRAALIASIKAGIAAGAIDPNQPVTVRFLSGSRPLGTDTIRVQGAK